MALLSSCASNPQKNFDQYVSEGKCEEAIKNLPSDGKTIFDETQAITGAVASYTLSGLAYGAEITIYLVGGVAVSAVICSPIIMLEASANSTGNISGHCFGSVMSTVAKGRMSDELLGKKIYRNTESWRCPDLSEFSRNLRIVASCYESKNDLVNLEKASSQLALLKEQNFQNNCIDENEREMITAQHESIHKKIAELEQTKK